MVYENSITQSVVEYVRNHPNCSRSEVIEGIGYTGQPVNMSNLMCRLRDMRLIEQVDSTVAPKLRRWQAIENKTDVMPMFMEMADDILQELGKMHSSHRQAYLGQRLQDLLGETIEK